MIRAEAHSDDFVFTAKFDATPWFRQATEAEIVALAREEWGGCYAADDVANFLEDKPGYASLSAMFSYLGNHPRSLSNEAVGFEVHVHRDDVVRWLHANRKPVFDEVAVVEGIDAGEESRLATTEAGVPSWDRDTSWTGEYDVPESPRPMAP